MAISKSLGNQLNRFQLALGGTQSHQGELPKEAVSAAGNLQSRISKIQDLNKEQEAAKQALATITKKIAGEVKAAQKEASKIVRLAEATYGPRDGRLKEFRPATEARARKQEKE